MSTKETGGPAFPFRKEGASSFQQFSGMSLRDWLAAESLNLGGEFFANLGNGCATPETVAEAAYMIADAMLKARSE